ncbi:hypothetical protein POM88_050349 [Heracleum sosnowskyi]|uniref:Polymerase nucleotidyl transferase domain-containing protein n=1 Tax=Heracleum sosnowskyi TaxID=360622 RepID=A0AAD8M2K3_9APIA|nr:hypothetical protein POM88_050349 [Heracleum sosnowskyi]
MGNFQELSVFEQTSFVSNPSFSQIGAERWAVAETAARNIISKLHPTVASHTTRFQVINYLRRLIKNLSGFEVFPYGSVPLKTYLPNGDIDLTVFCDASVEEALSNDIVSQLQREDHNNSAEFSVKEIRLVNAEVKLVKCVVQNIVVDISFNQVGGLCSLCFLDVVDYIIGKDHLFKQSILVIKAWCYYESRILGANLYKFMDYFSKFDWNNYGITLCGPVRLSSMSESGTGIPESVGGHKNMHLNIVDPLKEFNNLGCSVSEGNYNRIKSAFTFGARKLGQILMHSGDSTLAVELSNFFSNTLNRHGSGHRPDVQIAVNMLAATPTHHPIFNESNNEGEDGVCIFPTLDTANRHQIGNRSSDEVLQEPEEEEGTNFIHDRVSEARRHVGTVDVPSVTYPIAFSEKLFNTDSSLASANNVSSPESLDSMVDLRGRFETQFNILQYARCFYLFGSNMQDWPVPPPPPHFQSAHSSHAIQRSSLLNRFPYRSINGIVRGPRFYPINSMISPRASYGFERPGPRGTGTLFPILNQPLRGYRPSSVGGIIQAPVRSFHSIVTSSRFPAGQSSGLTWYSDGNHSASRGNADCFIPQPNGILECGPLLHAQRILPFQGSNMEPRPASSFRPRTPFQGRNRQQRPASSFPPSVQPWTLYPRHR